MGDFFFTFDDEGGLSWTIRGGQPALTTEQAAVVAQAESAQALKAVAAGLYQIAEEIRDASHRQSKD